MADTPRTVALAMTGASGAQYGLRLLQCLLEAGVRVYLMVSRPAQVVLSMETDLSVPGRPRDMERFLSERFGAASGQLQVFEREQWTAPVASGSSPPDAMVVCPCTTATLAAVSGGASRSLIERAADVALKERRRLVLVVRETPFSEIHLEHMLRLSRMGAVILPANPAFYHRPQSVDDLVDFVVSRVLDHLGVPNALIRRWGQDPDHDTGREAEGMA
ncbi:flavin prenyltransferase UbiX [Ectothiorhodospira marina]|uniref:Flavin prenyltransferase UbiX n=1 Tax=Ectothiorhodospira marina TaxID=1396821 RepID=A0A1H7NV70_9GAMM|nr:flavin prenyltransferase UbiX [Ectothiorhodospira marina]SEL26777.1 4-hydroxy-3-polyprenylbenzoate decarboxylase [Ectothiorhodospira marina]